MRVVVKKQLALLFIFILGCIVNFAILGKIVSVSNAPRESKCWVQLPMGMSFGCSRGIGSLEHEGASSVLRQSNTRRDSDDFLTHQLDDLTDTKLETKRDSNRNPSESPPNSSSATIEQMNHLIEGNLQGSLTPLIGAVRQLQDQVVALRAAIRLGAMQRQALPLSFPLQSPEQKGNPRTCNATNRNSTHLLHTYRGDKRARVHIHYHVQHHAGTMMYDIALRNRECGPRACRQSYGECMQSVAEDVEMRRILKLGYTFVPYELMLPANYPMPFLEYRSLFFFTTIMRHPIDRLLSKANDENIKEHYPEVSQGDYSSIAFVPDKIHGPIRGGYPIDNFSTRWLAGVPNPVVLTRSDLARAKCRLNAFDLVMVDRYLTEAVQNVLCNPLHWRWNCKSYKFRTSKSHNHSAHDRLRNDTLFGLLVERHRFDFELYDHALRLAGEHLVKYGVRSTVPEVAASSYVETLQQSMQLSTKAIEGLKEEWEDVRRADRDVLGAPDLPTYCERLRKDWRNNPDMMPDIIGGIV